MSQRHITLITFGQLERDFLERIAGSVMNEFQAGVKLMEAHMDLSDFFDPSRRQYNGNKLLKRVATMHQSDDEIVIGLFYVDLFIPILTYIFGQAMLNGHAGIASTYRLMNERYGLPSDQNVLEHRFTKEIIHEIGHTYGLIHCHSPVCVMRSSTYVEDIDLKERHLCNQCRSMAGLL